jgi:hypothetical protein
MSNHYHLLVETLEANLSLGMRQLNGVYAQHFNDKHKRVGHLFQGRYKSIIVDRETYLLELCRYVVLNPVRAKIVIDPAQYLWSSYLDIISQEKTPAFLTTDWVLGQFGEQPVLAKKRYSEFVYNGIGKEAPWSNLRRQIILGKEKFVRNIELLVGEINDMEIPKKQRLLDVPFTNEIPKLTTKIVASEARNKTIFDLHYKNGIPVNKIAQLFSLHPSSISKIINHKAPSQ